jgi:hypothetical protein
MKIFWWQNGLHFEPETSEERKALALLLASSQLTSIAGEAKSGASSGVLGEEISESIVRNA